MPRYPQLRSVFLPAAFILTALLILAIAISSIRMTNTLRRQRTTVDAELAKLRNLKAEADRERESMRQNERIILNVLSVCRIADDIPDFDCDRIASQDIGTHQVAFYLPPGNHTLQIATTCILKDSELEAASWSPSLPGGHGYLLEFKMPGKSKPVSWELTSNDPEFSKISEMLPLPEFSHMGTSWSHHQVISTPNSVTSSQLRQWSTTTFPLPPIQILRTTYSGKSGDVPCRIQIEIDVASDGPAHVDVELIEQVRTFNLERLLLPYKGGGNYRILPYDSAKRAVAP